MDFSIDNGSPVTARIVQYEDGENQTEIEEAYVTYEVDPSSSFTFGRFESALFFDAPANRALSGLNPFLFGSLIEFDDIVGLTLMWSEYL